VDISTIKPPLAAGCATVALDLVYRHGSIHFPLQKALILAKQDISGVLRRKRRAGHGQDHDPAKQFFIGRHKSSCNGLYKQAGMMANKPDW
jgi:hypothetical protein